MKESILLQVANYILWSLVLAAFHVCGTGILWEIAAMPENSKPWRVLRLLFVQCTRCSFWDQLLNRLWMRLCAHATVHRGPADNLQINERGPLPSTQIHVHVPSSSEIGKIEEDAPKDNRNNVEGEAEVFEEKEDAFQKDSGLVGSGGVWHESRDHRYLPAWKRSRVCSIFLSAIISHD